MSDAREPAASHHHRTVPLHRGQVRQCRAPRLHRFLHRHRRRPFASAKSPHGLGIKGHAPSSRLETQGFRRWRQCAVTDNRRPVGPPQHRVILRLRSQAAGDACQRAREHRDDGEAVFHEEWVPRFMAVLLRGRTDELLAGQLAVAVLVEVLEAVFEVLLALQTGLVFLEREDAVLVGVPAGEGFRADFGRRGAFGSGFSGGLVSGRARLWCSGTRDSASRAAWLSSRARASSGGRRCRDDPSPHRRLRRGRR